MERLSLSPSEVSELATRELKVTCSCGVCKPILSDSAAPILRTRRGGFVIHGRNGALNLQAPCCYLSSSAAI